MSIVKKVLIADDEPDILEIIEFNLKRRRLRSIHRKERERSN
jgi:hypothetical protein